MPSTSREVTCGRRISHDKLERRITISATVSEAAAEAFHNAKNLPKEVHRDARVVERVRLVA